MIQGRDPSQNAKELAKREIREKQAITTPSDRTSNLSSTQDRNEKRQFSALEEEQFRQWSKSIPLDEYGYRAPRIIELADVATPDKLILVGGMLGLRFREKGGWSNGGQITDPEGWIGKKLGNYELVGSYGKNEIKKDTFAGFIRANLWIQRSK